MIIVIKERKAKLPFHFIVALTSVRECIYELHIDERSFKKLWLCASWVERAKAQQRQRRAECYYKTINIKTTTILHFDIIFILFSILPLTIKFFEHSISSRMADPMRLHMLDYEMEMDAGKIYGKHLVWHHDNGSSVYSNERCLISIER